MSTKRIKGSIKAKQTPEFISVQRMSSKPTGTAKKYEPLDTRDFADFSDFTEITIENIKEACENHTMVHHQDHVIFYLETGAILF